MTAEFYKYQALGNDLIVIDPDRYPMPLTSSMVRLLCDRHLGIGGDGICYGPLPDTPQPHAMRFFNPDGSEAEKSGNGLRIFARYLWDAGYVHSSSFEVHIHDEPIQVNILDELATTITLQMGQLTFDSRRLPVNGPARQVVDEEMGFGNERWKITAVSIGNPHCIIFTEQLELIHTLGPLIETAPHFPHRTNVQLVQVVDKHTIQIEIWERGAGYTLASGTSTCAAAAAAVRTGRCQSPIEVHMPGGVAQVRLDSEWRAELTGTVTAVYQGHLMPEMIARLNNIP